MTWADFQATVLAFINRQSSDVPTIGSANLVVVAANMAKDEAQRRHHFKMARVQALLNSNLDGAALSSATLTDGTTAVTLKKIEAVWLYTTSGTTIRRYKKVPATTLGSLNREFPTAVLPDVSYPAPNPPPYPPYGNYDLYWYIQGTTFYLGGAVSPANVLIDGIKWMPAYDGVITDFFLTYHTDYMILKTVENMNRYLKEDQRVQISKTDLDARWLSVTLFDENFAEDNFEAGSTD